MKQSRILRTAIITTTLFLPLVFQSTSTAETIHTVPSFTSSDLVNGLRDDELRTILTTTGIFAIQSEAPSISTNTNTALHHVCDCIESLDPNHADVDGAVLADGVTRRKTLATATMSGIPLPMEVASSECHVDILDGLRDEIANASELFVTAMDRLLSYHDSSSKGSKGTSTTKGLLRDANGASYESLKDISKRSTQLEHFHVYTKPDTDTGEDVTEEALAPHTDAGLFLAFAPAHSCPTHDTHIHHSAHPPQTDQSFYIQPHNPPQSALTPVAFPPDSIVIMLGAGMEHWIDTTLQLRATRHAVRMRAGDKRAWYGMMSLVPNTAIIQTHPTIETFASMKQSLTLSHPQQGRTFGDGNDDTPQVTIGCGSSTHQRVDQRSSSLDISTPKKSGKSRRRLQMVNNGGDCNNSTNFYCWMSCLDIPDASNLDAHVAQGESLYCNSPSEYDATGNLMEAVEDCMNPQTLVPGGAMNSACMGGWYPTVQGVPSQKLNSTGTGGNSWEQRMHTDGDIPYCYGATSMFMQGFQWHSQTCVVYLFPTWIIRTPIAFLLACLGTIFLGVILEGIIVLRRIAIQSFSPGIPKLVASTLCYGAQLTFGYLLMLVVMTYSGPLVMSVVLGLMTGHFGLQLPRVLAGGTGADIPVEEGCTPCCQNEITSLHTTRTVSPNSSDASTGSSSSDPEKSLARKLLPSKKQRTVAHTAVEVLVASKPPPTSTPTPTADASRKESRPENISCCAEPIIGNNDVSGPLDVEYGSMNTEEDCCC